MRAPFVTRGQSVLNKACNSLVAVVVLAAVLIGFSGAVYANEIPPPGGVGEAPDTAQVTLGPATADVGQTIRGFIGPAGFDPTAGYPPAVPNPPTGFTPAESGNLLFGGTIAATSRAGLPLAFYCVDLNTDTFTGLGYNASAWSLSNIPNIALINRIINTYYPQSTLPAAAATNAQKAAAVQAAIWFLSDKFVVSTATPTGAALYPIVAGIISATLTAGPLPTEPPLPQVTIDGPTIGTAGQILGPYTLRTTAPDAAVTITGGQLFRDQAGTQPLTSPITLPAGSTFFVKTDAPATVTLSAATTSTAFAGSTALYQPANLTNPDPAAAQKLILAQSVNVAVNTSLTLVTTLASATPQPQALPLPVTGAPLAPIAIAGTILVVAGLAVLIALAARRRHARSRSGARPTRTAAHRT